jgi:hypothetical protein
MRYRIITASVLASMVFGASAQNAERRVSTEPATSPFTYEALGATPSAQPKKKNTAPADKNRTTARDSKGIASSGSSAPLAADTASNRAKPTSSTQK